MIDLPISSTSHAASLPARAVYTATAADLNFVLDLQRRWSNALGFLPKCCHERYINAGQVLIVLDNGLRAGYLNYTVTPRGLVRLPQVAVDASLLRSAIGSLLMRQITTAARRGHCEAIRLTSRSDLGCNLFWPTAGFFFSCLTRPNSTRGYPLLEWTLPLYDPTEIALAFVKTARHKRRHGLLRAPPRPIFNQSPP